MAIVPAMVIASRTPMAGEITGSEPVGSPLNHMKTTTRR